MEQQTILQKAEEEARGLEEEKPEDLLKARKDSLDGAKFSADTLYKDSALKSFAMTFSGILGSIMLFGAIGNTFDNIKRKRGGFWIYPKTIMEFTASGVLLGYALSHTLLGLALGISSGILTLVISVIIVRRSRKNGAP